MLPFNAHKNSHGFTLIEIVIILFIVGILSAIAFPSFVGLFNRSKVNNGVAEVQAALRQAEKVARRRSKACRVALTTGSEPKLTSNCFEITEYIIGVSAAASAGGTTVSVDALPIKILNGTGLVFSNGATGVVSTDAAKGTTSLVLSSALSLAITADDVVALRTLPNDVSMATNVNGSPIQIQFGFRGNTSFTVAASSNSFGTIILYPTGSTSNKKCVAISNGIGILRTGSYTGSTNPPSNITGACDQNELQ